ncbi:hypothetical protein FGO68_gene11776 [Halteria grandinella]|uniref:Uncharacterized protein n=1 Tax=Halteria grandinella TaxID=5974 RepID=A0A8J8SX78_HALGN|nr:hypothetical protein FGO68_gene11776 [Halteria grandinella]
MPNLSLLTASFPQLVLSGIDGHGQALYFQRWLQPRGLLQLLQGRDGLAGSSNPQCRLKPDAVLQQLTLGCKRKYACLAPLAYPCLYLGQAGGLRAPVVIGGLSRAFVTSK